MVITSENKQSVKIRFKSSQFNYAVIYVITTFIVLLFLNIYSTKVSQDVFFNSKKASMIEKCQLTASEIARLDVLNTSTVSNVVSEMDSLRVTRLIVTDQTGLVIYDSTAKSSAAEQYAILPEIIQALEINDVFTSNYQDGAIQSRTATPVISYATLIGCVYMMEYDTQLGALIQTLQNNTFTITFVLELLVILFSFIFSKAFTRRLRRIMTTMRTIRSGDYSQEVHMGGNDELTVLGSEFNDLLKRLRTSEQKRNNFVSDASHELKTPLASIKLLSDSILQNEMDLQTTREFVQDIGNEAERLNRMTQKLLSLSHVEGQSDSDCEIVYIFPTVERVVRMLTPVAEKGNITISQELIEDSSILILEDDLYQIIFNLVENGIKYNVSGGSLHISLQKENDNAVLTVTDTGVGIPKEALGHIFERFFRVDKARSRKSGGSGLGLAIVRIMVERNHGTIQVESTVSVGTKFTVSFPVFDMEDME